jgi:hypothetical protein
VTVTIATQTLSTLEVRTVVGGSGFKGITSFVPQLWVQTNVTLVEGGWANLNQGSAGQEIAIYTKEGWLYGIFDIQYFKTGIALQSGVDESFGFGHDYDPNFVLFVWNADDLYAYVRKGNASTYSAIGASKPADYATAYHDYKIVWEVDNALFYIDGVLVKTLTTNVPNIPLYIRFCNRCNVAGTPVEMPCGGPAFALVSPLGETVLSNLKMDIAAQTVGNIGIDIKAQTLTNLNINIAAQDADITVSISAQTVDITVLAPTGKMVSSGGAVASNTHVDLDAFSANTERTLLTVSGRGKLSHIGFWFIASSATEPVEDTQIRIYIDGALKFQSTLIQIDTAFNGGALLTQPSAVSTKYYANAVNPTAALTYCKTCSDVDSDLEYVGGFINIVFEYTTSFSVRVFNANKAGLVSVGVAYGAYV